MSRKPFSTPLLFLPLLLHSLLLAQPFSGGTGTLEDPYRIAVKADLKTLGGDTAYLSKHFLLTADIRFDSADFAPEGAFHNSGGGFIPIGRGTSTRLRFKGTFDGRNFVISGLRINRPSGTNQAMFGETDSGSEIRNIRLENVDVSGSEYVAGLVGRCLGRIADASVTGVVRAGNPLQTNLDLDAAGGVAGEIQVGGTIENSKAAVAVSGTGRCVGGLAGSSDGLIRNSSASGKVDGKSAVGGLVGLLSAGRRISNSFATGSVVGTEQVGGLVGYNYGGDIDSSSAAGMVTGSNQVGGLIGWNVGSAIQSFATGRVSGEMEVGGLVGLAAGRFTDVFATGDVDGKEKSGGLIGSLGRGSLSYAYSIGKVNPAAGSVGGLIGHSIYDTVSKCFWDQERSAMTGSRRGTGKTTAQMKTAATYADSGWDFDSTWTIDERQNFGYPYFRWNKPSQVPSIRTLAPANLSKSGIKVGGALENLGALPLVTYGLVWNVSGLPERGKDPEKTIGNAQAILSFQHDLEDLQPATRYFIRAFAENANGVAYGNEVSITTVPYEGAGTAGSPYQIRSKTDLKFLGLDTLNWGRHYALVQDIRLDTSDYDSGGIFFNGGRGFQPIGRYQFFYTYNQFPFTGVFDGNRHTISGIRFHSQEDLEEGVFFSYVRDATIRNLGLTDMDIKGGEGALAGHVVGNSLISDSYTTGKLTRSTSSGAGGGGLVGVLFSPAKVVRCHSTVTVEGAQLIGGLVGASSGTIVDSYATGRVKGDSLAGGLVGENSGPISRSYATGDVWGNSVWGGLMLGGLAGRNEDTISDCHATGKVTGSEALGGLVGFNEAGALIQRSRAGGSVVLEDEKQVQYFGGLVGTNLGEIAYSFATGDVDGLRTQFSRRSESTGWFGGLVGNNGGLIHHCHASGRVLGGSVVGGLVGDNTFVKVNASRDGLIRHSYATGIVATTFVALTNGQPPDSITITAKTGTTAGGLAGNNGTGRIEDCYATGLVAASGYVGGLVGSTSYSGAIVNSYSIGRVVGKERLGGLVGGHPDIRDGLMAATTGSFWDVQTSRQDTTFGGSGKTTAEMKRLITFTGKGSPGLGSPWDFAGNPNDDTADQDEWAMADSVNQGYPYLKKARESAVALATEGAISDIPGWARIHRGLAGEIVIDTRNPADVRIAVFDLTGKSLVASGAVPDAKRTRHTFRWNAGGAGALPAGTYIVMATVKGLRDGRPRSLSALVCLTR